MSFRHDWVFRSILTSAEFAEALMPTYDVIFQRDAPALVSGSQELVAQKE